MHQFIIVQVHYLPFYSLGMVVSLQFEKPSVPNDVKNSVSVDTFDINDPLNVLAKFLHPLQDDISWWYYIPTSDDAVPGNTARTTVMFSDGVAESER